MDRSTWHIGGLQLLECSAQDFSPVLRFADVDARPILHDTSISILLFDTTGTSMAAITLVKNATLWQWSDNSINGMKTGRAVPLSWFCIEKGAITMTSENKSGATDTGPPADENYDSIIDAKNQLVIPGLHDAHIHVAMTGESNYFLNLKGCDSIEKMISSLSIHASKFPVSVLPWISGVNWDQVREL